LLRVTLLLVVVNAGDIVTTLQKRHGLATENRYREGNHWELLLPPRGWWWKGGPLETAAHALFECEFYDAIRPPLIAASTAWCLESGIPADDAGRAAALRWAVGCSACATAFASASADCVLRDSIAAFYAQAMFIRFNKSTSKSTDQGAASQPSSPE
jgi:hypothetical protein